MFPFHQTVSLIHTSYGLNVCNIYVFCVIVASLLNISCLSFCIFKFFEFYNGLISFLILAILFQSLHLYSFSNIFSFFPHLQTSFLIHTPNAIHIFILNSKFTFIIYRSPSSSEINIKYPTFTAEISFGAIKRKCLNDKCTSLLSTADHSYRCKQGPLYELQLHQ